MHSPSLIYQIKTDLVEKITLSQQQAKRFFKTSPNSYSENDKFLGITVPSLREIAKKYKDLDLQIVEELLKSEYNEERLLALFILVSQYKKGKDILQTYIYQLYINNLQYINNWNLVDSSAHLIIGSYLWKKDRSILYELAKSQILWERRIAIVSSWYFIRQGDIDTTFRISEILLFDLHDLIHKAVGWMLREAGKIDEDKLYKFISTYAKQMPKTMLRYAIEKFTKEQKANIKNFFLS